MVSGKPSSKLDKGRSDKKVAESVGYGRTTLAKAEAVVEAAEEDPEAVARKRQLEPMERDAARERMLSGQPSGNFPEGSKGEVRDKVGAAVGVSGKTLQKAREVVEAAEEDPETFGPARFLCRIIKVM